MVGKDNNKIIDNLEILENESKVIVSVNPKLYPLDTIYSASYMISEKAYVVLNGDPDSEVMVTIRKKSPKSNLE